tara:strand:+ start:760 stop:1470 length:711 start_codon:yes stop_codon:yes gene_type:complete
MPLKNGELTTPEIRKLIKAHNVLVSIKIPKGSKREDIIKILLKEGYRIDHENGRLRPVAKGKVKKMKVISQKTINEVLPKPKTSEEKKVAKKKRDETKQKKETEAFKKRQAQVEALKKVQARRKKGEIKKPSTVVPEFETIKQLEKYFDKQIDIFKKEITKFRNKIKAFDDKKQVQQERMKLRKLGNKRVLDILEANEELFEDDEEAYERLETKYESAIEKPITMIAGNRIEELKK